MPGVDCGFSTFDACVNYSLTLPPIQFTLASATTLGVWCSDVGEVAGIGIKRPLTAALVQFSLTAEHG